MPRKRTPTDVWGLYETLMQRTAIDPVGGCWIWNGTRERKGYGTIGIDGGIRKIHRLAWALYFGPVPTGKHVLHRCDNPPCWNPGHLWLGTNLENHQDSARKKRRANTLALLTPEQEALRRAHLRHGEAVWHLAKLTEPQVLAIRADRRAGLKLKDIASKHGIPYKTIDKIVYRYSWKHLP